MTWLQLSLFLVVVVPLAAYITVKMATAGFFRGRRAYQEWLEENRKEHWEDDGC